MRAGYNGTITSPEIERVVFRFLINGTSDPDSLLPGFQGVTDVARTGVGVFTVQFETKYPVLIGVTGNVLGPDSGSAVNDQLVKTTGNGYNATTGVLTLTVVDSGTAAAADPADNSWVYVEAVFGRRSNMHPSKAI